MDEDYINFCMKCGWNDLDYGCISPRGEELYQCQMYMHYHPDEVKEFERFCMEYENRNSKGDNYCELFIR